LFTFLHMREINLLPNLSSVLSKDMLEPKKDFFVMIHMHVELVSLGMSFFF
jgi:hypothetical protein